MSSHKNRVKMTVSGTPGTGTITLNAASSGYQSFATAYAADATVDILITEGTAWEVARDCAYTHSGTTLSRGTLEESSTGSAVSFTSAAVVSVILSAAKGNNLEAALQSVVPGGRLTLESGVPVSTTDQTAKTSVYYAPYVHNIINLWDGATWVPTVFAETTLALGTLTSGKPYDVFGYLSSGALVLELLAWTSDTARATAVTLQDGRYCKSGDKTRLLLGTFYTTSTTTTEDSAAKRHLWNLYNRVSKHGAGECTTNHTYTTGSYREWNAGSSVTRCNFIIGLVEDSIYVGTYCYFTAATAVFLGYGAPALNSTTTPAAQQLPILMGSLTSSAVYAEGYGVPALGLNYATVLEYGNTGCNYQNFKMNVKLRA